MGVTKHDADQTAFVVKKTSAGNIIKTRVSGESGGELVASIQKTNEGVSYLVAGRNITITTASNGQVTIGNPFPPLNIVPSPIRVTGSVETIIASLYVDACTYQNAIALFGSELSGSTTTLRVKQFTLSSSILVLTGGIGRASVVSTGSILFPSSAWYDVTIANSAATGSSLCSGIKFF